MEKIKSAWKYIVDGHFIVAFVRWLVRTGGNIGESAFLLATLWVTLNAVAHVMLTWFIPTHIIELLNYLSLVAFSLLPELIIIPIAGTCYNHWCVLSKDNSRKDALVWALLYTIPALVFLGMTIFTISSFVSTGGLVFTPATGWQLVTRALFGWMFSAVNMLFAELGKPNYASKLADKNAEIDRLKGEIDAINRAYSIEKSGLLDRLANTNQQVNRLAEKASSLALQGLEIHPTELIQWLNSGIKTVSVDELITRSGYTKRKINSANLERDRRNPNLIRVSSVLEWLKRTPPPNTVVESENHHSNGIEHDTDALSLPVFAVTSME